GVFDWIAMTVVASLLLMLVVPMVYQSRQRAIWLRHQERLRSAGQTLETFSVAHPGGTVLLRNAPPTFRDTTPLWDTDSRNMERSGNVPGGMTGTPGAGGMTGTPDRPDKRTLSVEGALSVSAQDLAEPVVSGQIAVDVVPGDREGAIWAISRDQIPVPGLIGPDVVGVPRDGVSGTPQVRLRIPVVIPDIGLSGDVEGEHRLSRDGCVRFEPVIPTP
ncbi:MAG: hypothetical protein Q4C47_04935, partial [Planctomycetia bacterium]|nr:hypothetical protein [Planctomycetia bacterium]